MSYWTSLPSFDIEPPSPQKAPMILTPTRLAQLWYEAAAHEIGLRLVLADPKSAERVINALYNCRKSLLDQTIDSISICRPPGGKELWMVKQGVDMNEVELEPTNV